jgi:hypothetical protein
MSELIEAAGMPVKRKIGDVEYTFMPMTIGDSAEVERWAEEQVWKELKRRHAEAPDADVKKLLAHRMATITKTELRQEAQAYIESPESNPVFMHLMLSEHHNLTIEQVAGLVSMMDFKEIYAKVHNLGKVDEITKLEQQFFGSLLPELFAKLDDKEDHDIEHPADLVERLRTFWARYQKELQPDRPPVDA